MVEEIEDYDVEDRLDGKEAWEVAFEKGEKAANEGKSWDDDW